MSRVMKRDVLMYVLYVRDDSSRGKLLQMCTPLDLLYLFICYNKLIYII